VASEHSRILCIPGLEGMARSDLASRLRDLRVDVLKPEGFRAGDAVAIRGLRGATRPQTKASLAPTSRRLARLNVYRPTLTLRALNAARWPWRTLRRRRR